MAEGLQANLFIGIHVTDKLREQLDKCEPYNERFFKRNDPEYLQMTTSSEKSYIGKRLSKKADYEDLDNVVSNITSILKKICPDYYFDKNQFTIFTEISIG